MFPSLNLGVGVVVLVFTAGAFCFVAGSEQCRTKEAVQTIQRACTKNEEDMLAAEGDADYAEVCRQFPLLMICAATALPQCYNDIERTFSIYGHSPYSCELTPETIKELQEIVRKGTQVEELTTSTIDTTTTSVEQEEQYGRTFHSILTSPASRGSMNVTQKKTEIHPGSKEKHKGTNTHDDGSVVMYSIPTVALLLVTTPLLRWSMS
ncbi:unnamed protein product [Candidula unifasciata]|uniref:Uncharacterized protein n=1 Tax=Candidula unifasciata TaxID=100452 RepID=A0A8S3YVL2_9EUPU|nr:unnamed protein product [Candidula unifasciata]